jgi:diacylglycerol kinase family enzyme
MKHLFIINPKARLVKNQGRDMAEEIRAFFINYPEIKYDIHITRWKRDAVGFVRRYVSVAPELVRVYASGGTGTLFEVVNGTIGLPNVQISVYPMGLANAFVSWFGKEKVDMFRSLWNLVFSRIVTLDAIRYGDNFGIAWGAVGIDAQGNRDGNILVDNFGIPPPLSFWAAGAYHASLKKNVQHLRISVDGQSFDGDYKSVIIANEPTYGFNFNPAVDARPDNGVLDIYLVRPASLLFTFPMSLDYETGSYHKWPEHVVHVQGKKICLLSDQTITICLDGEVYLDSGAEFEIIPRAIDFALPTSVDIPGQGGKE